MKVTSLICAAALAFIGSIGVAMTKAEPLDSNEARIKIGFDYTKTQDIQLDFSKKDRKLVGLGAYLVNAVGGCNDCHSAPPYRVGNDPNFGQPKHIDNNCYLAGGQDFGIAVSRDITPWEDGKPAGLSLDRFIHVIRTGEDPDNPGQLLKIMPWPVYQAMSDGDLTAVYEYLSAIPPINANSCGVPSE